MKTASLKHQIEVLQATHSDLTVLRQQKSKTVIGGNLCFEAAPKEGPVVTDDYDIEIYVPRRYSRILPLTKEVGGCVHQAYGHFLEGGYLCLGVAVEVRRYFEREPTLLGYVNNLVIPFLYNYRRWAETGEAPFGELKHGSAGILQFYYENLETDSSLVVLRVLLQLLESGCKPMHRCPCGSTRETRKCHGRAMHRLLRYHTTASLKHDFIVVVSAFREAEPDVVSKISPSEESGVMRQLKKIINF